MNRIERRQSAPRTETLEKIADALGCSVLELSGTSERPTTTDVAFKTVPSFVDLRQFPTGFSPAAVIVGDRREDPPKTAGDLLAFAGSPCDLTFLPGLDLHGDTEVISDKVFVHCSDQELRKRFGDKHLLCVGSPSTNSVSRKINEFAIFRFNIEPEILNQLTLLESDVKKAQECEASREALAEIVQNERKRRQIRAWLMTCRARGIVDPTSDGIYLRGLFTHPDDDWGVISLAPHPYRDKGDFGRIAVLVAGAHLPGTIYGLKMLASRGPATWKSPSQWFAEHPYGGVFKVAIEQKPWGERLQSLTSRWSTSAYTAVSLSDSFAIMRDAKKQNLRSRQSIEEVTAFLASLSGGPTASLRPAMSEQSEGR